MYGIDSEDHSDIWKTLQLELYCRQVDPRDIFYKDNSFDYVVWPDPIKFEEEEDINRALKEIHRVGRITYLFNCPLSSERDMGWWIDKFLGLNYYIEVASRLSNGGLLLEAKKE
jgi:ubiquinone/menaquinone biosynthesis C-methylase UbiE